MESCTDRCVEGLVLSPMESCTDRCVEGLVLSPYGELYQQVC